MYRFCGKKAKVVGIKKKYCEQFQNDFYYRDYPTPDRFAVDLITLDIDGGNYSWSLDMFQWKNTMIIRNE